ncbi:hypothetical protein L0664_01105 [Octadecabacter sp. G9-8]|uniref:Uncharacterized protein n=1 Tax=Octadecabacter dasysiphoniae TaxID=2909341 RepID=A0ABS9CQZ2_9RHOB|nr:hypothetical protein [Octadecabacter dasysiphoniae]MCF2869650.1 hypothetical protein [Octadecabacter dasysiphoniae]
MTRFGLAALGAAMALGACTPPEITSRADTYDTLNSGFATAEAYTPRPVGTRSQNDFMRFSTMGPQ